MGGVVRLMVLASIVLLSGCATKLDFTRSPVASGATVHVVDNRQASERTRRRDGVMVPLLYFGDDDFVTPPLKTFSSLLESRLSAGNYELDIEKFRVIDVLPMRLRGATMGALAGALGSMGYSVYFTGTERLEQDNITCIVSGSFQSKSVSTSASVPYQIPGQTIVVRNEPAFRDAVYECLDRLAESVAKSM